MKILPARMRKGVRRDFVVMISFGDATPIALTFYKDITM